MGHTLGAIFHIPHGRTVGIFLPYTIEFAARAAPDRYAELAESVGCPSDDDEGKTGMALALAKRIRDLCRETNSPTSIAELGIDRAAFESALDKLVDDAFNDTTMVTTCRGPSYDELRQLFLYAYEGRPIDF
jgi:alcohol dehydrogenase class IV